MDVSIWAVTRTFVNLSWYTYIICMYMWRFFSNRGTPKSSILVGFSIINHPAIGVPPLQETPIWCICMHIYTYIYICTNLTLSHDLTCNSELYNWLLFPFFTISHDAGTAQSLLDHGVLGDVKLCPGKCAAQRWLLLLCYMIAIENHHF